MILVLLPPPTAAISSASPSTYWSLTLCHHKTIQLCGEGKLKKGRGAPWGVGAVCSVWFMVGLFFAHSLRLGLLNWKAEHPLAKDKETKRKKMFGRKLRYTGQTSPFNELLWHDEIVHTMLEWSCNLAAMAENQTSSRCDLKQYFSPFFMLISGSATKPPWAATAVTWCAAAVATTHTQRS